TAKDKAYDDLYKTHWGGRIAIVSVILAIAGGLAYLQWRSGHAAASTATPKTPTAARVDNTGNNSPANPSAAPGTSSTNPPSAASTQTSLAPANAPSPASNPAGNQQLPNGSSQTQANVSAPASPAAKPAAAAANNAKAAAPADSIRDLEEPVRLAENYIQG